MIKIHRRVILPLVLLVVIVLLILIEPKQEKDALYQTGSHIIDTFSHLSLGSTNNNNNNNNNKDNKVLKPADVKNINNFKSKGSHEENNEDKEKEKEKEKSKEELDLDPCTVINPLNKGFIDLRSLSAFSNEGKALPWNAKGFDSGKNYTIGVCSNPFKKARNDPNEIQDNVNATKIGAYYIDHETNKFVSMGEFSTTPKFRGKKLTLTYENGAYCNKLMDTETGERLRKSTILTFTCDREMMAKASISYVGSSNDCSYYFEIRSHHACPTVSKANNLAAAWIFVFIVFAAFLVFYFSGGFLLKQMKSKQVTKV